MIDRRKFLFHSAAGAAVLGAAPSSFAQGKAKSAPASQAIDFDTLLEVTKTPGLAAKGMIGGKQFEYAVGMREAGKPEKITAETVFSAASLSKPVFAMAARKLVREGKLDWRRPLQDYMPLGLSGDAATVTVENVLTHGTGFVNWRFDQKANEELVSAFKPGTKWQYSGEGYVLLQRVVEYLVGEPLGGYLNRKLLPSLGMNSSTYTWTPEIEKVSTYGHNNRGEVYERWSAWFDRRAYDVGQKAGTSNDKMTYDQFMAAAKEQKAFALPVGVSPNVAGSMWTTVGDYFNFVQKSLEDYAKNPEEYKPRNPANSKISWALSWGVDTSLDSPGYFHWGDGSGVKNFTLWQPAKKTAWVIFTNSDHGASAYRVLARRLMGGEVLSAEWV
jgi:CubicO group peptidase (beta-lactamase class C family)